MQKDRLPVWALAWIAVVLAAMVVFLANQDAVDRLLAVSGLERVLYPQGKAAGVEVVQAPEVSPEVLLDPAPEAPRVLVETPTVSGPGTGSDVEPGATEPAAAEEPEPPLPTAPNTYRLYFLKLSPEGRLEPSAFVRELPAGSTPLGATIRALLLGPTLQDKAQGALTMIPQGTKLLSLRIKDRIALVSLSSEFEHNASGLEGIAGQLRELVWTATQFGTVDGVQVLIEGQYRDFLGDSEGIFLSEPLTRASLP